jgi:LuxR family maltose regulon positive regulatory protein
VSIAVEHTAPPRLPGGLVWRARLAKILDEGVRHTATLVSAGPGWGKTALVASWAAARSISGPVAWLTLDAQHNDPHAFWCDLLLAMHTAGAVPSGAPLPGVNADEAGYRHAFMTAVSNTAVPVVVVLDDLHEVTDDKVLAELAAAMRSRRARFVLIARREPALALHRYRLGGDLTEIRAADLGFQLAEATELLALESRSMPADCLAALVRRNEGWSAGLRLALDAPDQARADEVVEDYLLREVLGEQPDEIRRFLLRTSIPDRICGDLAEALTGRPHGHMTLEDLAGDNLFIERTGNGRWFRYHGLFRSALRRRAARRWPDTTANLHLAAAGWYETAGNPLAAITHAVLAGEWDLVAAITVRNGLAMLGSADRAEFVEALRQIPPARLGLSAELAVCAVILSYAQGDLAAVPRRLAAARALLNGRSEAADSEVSAALAILEAGAVIRWQGDMPQLVRATTTLLADLSRLSFDRAPALSQFRAVALNSKGAGLLWSARYDYADRYLWAAASTARTADVPHLEINSFGLLALLAVMQGALREAVDHAASAENVARRIDAEGRLGIAPAYLARALVESERCREPQAEEALRRGLHASGELPEAALSILAGLIRIRLMLDRGEMAGARTMLSQLRAEAGPPLVAAQLERLLGLTGAEIQLGLGNPAWVLREYTARAGLVPAEQICLARAHLAVGNLPAAGDLLARIQDSPDRVSVVGAWILTALSADSQGRSSVASDALSRALAVAEPEQIRRPFRIFDTQRMMVLAERQQWLTELHGTAGDGALAEITGEIPVIMGVQAAGPLSEREIDVLQYLPTVLTAAEIAENLNISVNTVKAHMRSIYRKLGAGRRREAVVTARQTGLI